jgi:hypothetical protein
MNKRLGSRAALLVAASLALAMPARAQNLLQDSRFDGTTDPWIVFDAIYDGDHSALADGTGSAAVSVPDSEGIGTQVVVLKQCVTPIVPGARYSFGGTIRIPSTLAAAGAVKIELIWHTASDCSDDGLTGAPLTLANPPGPTDVWENLAGTAVAPSGTVAASLAVVVENDGPLLTSAPVIRPEATVVSFAANVDDLFLDPAPIVPTLGGTGLALLVVSLAGAGFLVLRR